MRAMILGQEEMALIQRVKSYALSHLVSEERARQIREGDAPPVGADQGHCCEIPVGFSLVFSIEECPDFFARHLTVSINSGPELFPHPSAIEALLTLFDMGALAGADRVYETTNFRGHAAIGVVEVIREPSRTATSSRGEHVNGMARKKRRHAVPELVLDTPTTCPHCGGKIEGAVGLGENTPKPGTILVCIRCADLSAFDETMGLRQLTAQEIVSLRMSSGWPTIARAVEAVQERIGRHDG